MAKKTAQKKAAPGKGVEKDEKNPLLIHGNGVYGDNVSEHFGFKIVTEKETEYPHSVVTREGIFNCQDEQKADEARAASEKNNLTIFKARLQALHVVNVTDKNRYKILIDDILNEYRETITPDTFSSYKSISDTIENRSIDSIMYDIKKLLDYITLQESGAGERIHFPLHNKLLWNAGDLKEHLSLLKINDVINYDENCIQDILGMKKKILIVDYKFPHERAWSILKTWYDNGCTNLDPEKRGSGAVKAITEIFYYEIDGKEIFFDMKKFNEKRIPEYDFSENVKKILKL